jgi:CRISPR-associated exonuclease Cas4
MTQPVVAISALEHHMYCPRQCALIHVDGIWTDNEHTVRGTAGHRRPDTGADRMERGMRALWHVPLWSNEHGLTGRADVILAVADRVVPVEYKIGRRHELAADVQLCAQALCLEEMLGLPVRYGFVWYSAPRRRARVDLDVPLRDLTVRAIGEVRGWLLREKLPPAPADARCASCQLLDHCQPDVCAAPERVDAYVAGLLVCDS